MFSRTSIAGLRQSIRRCNKSVAGTMGGIMQSSPSSGLRTFTNNTTIIRMNSSVTQSRLASIVAPASTSDNGQDAEQWRTRTILALLGALGLATLASEFNPAQNCGIVGVVGTNTGEDCSGFLLEGLTILRNRGYDSAGVASVNKNGTLSVTKYASRDSTSDSIDLVRGNVGKHAGHLTGIAHTRWATHGGKTDLNAHPHTDSKNRVAIVHNGTINNSHELRKELQTQHGIKFNSETDTEVIAQLIGIYLDKGLDTKEAVAHALGRCDGSWGLAVINKAMPDEIVVACNGSPMMIGLGQNKTYIASETSAFSKYTKVSTYLPT